MGLWDALSGSGRRERARREEAAAQEAERRRADEAAAAGVLRRWDAAVEALRAQLRTPDGHFFLDAMAWSVVAGEATAHREGPVAPPTVLAEVLAALGEDSSDGVLAELYAADVAVGALSGHPPTDAGARNALRDAVRARVPLLAVAPAMPYHPAHAAAQHLLARLEARINADPEVWSVPALRFTATDALASARWWPGRDSSDLPEAARAADPLRLAYLGRGMMEHRISAATYAALGDANDLALGRGLPPVEPAQWLLSALRYRAERLRGL